MNKEYFSIPEGESQYADIDLTKTSMVKARYIHAAEETDAGNIFIEALPPYRSPEECESDYFKPMPGYDAEKACSLSDYRKHIQIDRLQEVRFPLPYQDTLEAGFYLMLLRSYRARTMTTYFNHEQSVTVADRVNLINAHVNGNANSHAIVGMALIGISGCGKSSTLSILTSRYPQVIFHETPDFLRTTQIVHLTVQCPQNSNFSTLYLNIGIAIDKALGNSEPVYANEISKERTLGAKAAAVCRLINKFSIGCIILDEIQCIDFGSLSEKSYDAITTIVNETNVGILSVGTEEAADTMFSKLRQMRRIGRCINGCDYIDNHEYFGQIIDSLWEYQWFDKPVAITDEIAETLYQCSYGVVYLLTQIYISMWDAYLEAPANSFTKDEMISGMTQALTEKTWSDSLSDRLIKDDCSAILSMYTAVKEKHPDPEDKKVSPFAVLGLLSNNGALYSREQPVFSKISPAVISYMLSPVLLNNGSLLIDEIVSGSNLPGRILHLNRVVVNEFLDALQEKGEIIINRTAGLDIVYPAAMPTQQEILNTYYRGR